MAQKNGWWRGLTLGAVVTVAPLFGCASTHAQASGASGQATVAKTHAVEAADGKSVPYTSSELGFELDKPAGDHWALATNVTSPEGRPIPVVVAHPDSGAQIVVQVSEPVDSPKVLAGMLREKLNEEASLNLGKPERLDVDSGSEAYGFNFGVKGEASGRVAVIEVGDQIVLVVASWPEGADKAIVHDIDNVVKSVRPASKASPALMRPDKA